MKEKRKITVIYFSFISRKLLFIVFFFLLLERISVLGEMASSSSSDKTDKIYVPYVSVNLNDLCLPQRALSELFSACEKEKKRDVRINEKYMLNIFGKPPYSFVRTPKDPEFVPSSYRDFGKSSSTSQARRIALIERLPGFCKNIIMEKYLPFVGHWEEHRHLNAHVKFERPVYRKCPFQYEQGTNYIWSVKLPRNRKPPSLERQTMKNDTFKKLASLIGKTLTLKRQSIKNECGKLRLSSHVKMNIKVNKIVLVNNRKTVGTCGIVATIVECKY